MIPKAISNLCSRMSFYLSLFTIENVKRAFFFILAGDFRLIFRVLKIRAPFSGKDKRIKNTDVTKWIANNISEQPEAGAAAYSEAIDAAAQPEAGAAAYTGVVDIIVPVYNGIEFFDALFKSLPCTNIDYNLYIIDDCSPDERVAEYLQNLANKDKRVRIITNDANLGFVQSVNTGFSYTTNHVALLNSDIELPPHWLERLMYPIINLDKIASSTPFTNSGTLNSFPRIGENNLLFESLTCEEIDSAFRTIKPTYTSIPTGVGFCMGINKNALKEIGAFDAETFTRGFGEENDWCQRAKKAGYKNVMVENLFVYHKHGGSFSGREKEELIKRNNKLHSKKHPRYNADVTAFFGKDPLKLTRDFMAMYLLSRHNARKQLLVFDHSLAGGATIYLDGLIKQNINDGNGVIVIRYDSKQLMFLLEFWCKDHKFDFNIGKIEDIRLILKQVRCDEIIINELATFNKPYELMGLITEIQKEFDTGLIMYVHDYYCVCPTITLLDFRRQYCHLPGADVCRKCFSRLDFKSDYESIETWRRHWGGFLSSCDEVIVFSNDSRNILENIYGAMKNLVVTPHKVDYIIKQGKDYKTTDHINIGLIGFLNYHKGLSIIREMLKIIERRKLNVRIILIGSSHKVLKHKNYRETGKYNKESLPLLSMQNDIDVFFIASIWPETFSYTTEEAIKMDMPVAAFNLGAPAERVSTYNKRILIDTIDAEAALNKIVGYYNEHLASRENPYKNVRVLFVGEYDSFSSRYRVEHFREQLLIQGISSDYVNKKALKRVDPRQYNTVVIYRCRHTSITEATIKAFHEHGKKVFYDIDDYIFSYDDIKDLDFLSGEDYKGFEKYSNEIRKCMALCDGFITSTTYMKQAIQTAFPNAPVVINRNVASIEMASLSTTALNKIRKSADRVVMGYFSGSKTHDGDFGVIADTVLTLFEKYDFLHLKIVGCLNLSDAFKEYEDRITHIDFVDWRELPDLIASADINLMPIEDTFFHRCKSENKWTEAALVATPTVCSYNNELEPIIQDGITGFLCRTEAQWESVLTRLIEDPDLRMKVGSAAKDVAYKHYITTGTGMEAIDFINQ